MNPITAYCIIKSGVWFLWHFWSIGLGGGTFAHSRTNVSNFPDFCMTSLRLFSSFPFILSWYGVCSFVIWFSDRYIWFFVHLLQIWRMKCPWVTSFQLANLRTSVSWNTNVRNTNVVGSCFFFCVVKYYIFNWEGGGRLDRGSSGGRVCPLKTLSSNLISCFTGTSDPSIEVISLMKALHVLNSHWTTLYEVSVIR